MARRWGIGRSRAFLVFIATTSLSLVSACGSSPGGGGHDGAADACRSSCADVAVELGDANAAAEVDGRFDADVTVDLADGPSAGEGGPPDGDAAALPDAAVDVAVEPDATDDAATGDGDGSPLDPLACVSMELEADAMSKTPLRAGITPMCGGSTPICCPGGVPSASCPALLLDMTAQPGDSPRLILANKPGAMELDVSMRARIRSEAPIPITIPIVGDCTMTVDSQPGPKPDVQIDVPVQSVTDGDSGRAHAAIGTIALTDLTTDDVSLGGGVSCQIANLGLSFFLTTLTSVLTEEISGLICNSCPCT